VYSSKRQLTVKGFKNTSCRENTQRAAGELNPYVGKNFGVPMRVQREILKKIFYREVTSSNKLRDLYSEDIQFESRSGHQLPSQVSLIYSDTLVKFFYRYLLDTDGFLHIISHSILLLSVIIIRRYVT